VKIPCTADPVSTRKAAEFCAACKEYGQSSGAFLRGASFDCQSRNINLKLMLTARTASASRR